MPVLESLLDKVLGLQPATLLKKRLCRRYFPKNLAELFQKRFFAEHLQANASASYLKVQSCKFKKH